MESEYKKDFDQWNKVKKELQTSMRSILFQEREIWWAYVGVNIGVEQDGKGRTFTRPVLIFKKYSRHHFIGIPLTTKARTKRFGMLLRDVSFLASQSWLVFSQIRVYDTRRLYRKLGKLPQKAFWEIVNKSALGLLPEPRVPSGNSTPSIAREGEKGKELA